MVENDQLIKNFFWRLMERWGAKGISIIVSIILARKLGPEAYGTIALITAIMVILQVFIDSGFGVALIQKKDADDLDFSSVFWFNILICILLYILMFFTAPFIAAFYSRNDLVPLIRVVSLVLIISGVKNIQQAYVSRNLMFKKFFFSTLAGTIGAAVIGLTMAFYGCGVWALVAQYLLNTVIDTLVLWLTVKWRPKLKFSFDRFKLLFSFGWKMLASSLIDTTYQELRSLIIGKFYSSDELAFYNKGAEYPKFVVSNVNESMNSVLLPVFSKKQDDKNEIKITTRKVIRTTSYLICPMMAGLCAISDNLILLLLGKEWLPVSVFLKIACIGQALQPIQTTNLSVVKALGRSDIHLKIEIIKKTIAIIILILTSMSGVKMIAIGSVVYAIIATYINSFPNNKLIAYGYIEQIVDVLPFIGMSAIVSGVVYLISMLCIPVWLVLILQILSGMIVYLVLSIIVKVGEFNDLLKIAKQMFNKRIKS